MPKTSEQFEKIKTERKNGIIVAGLKIFCEKGYDGTTIDDITQKANISHGLFYHYFKSKQEIVDAVVTGVGANTKNHILKIVEENICATEKLKKLTGYFFTTLTTDNFGYFFYFFLSRRFSYTVSGEQGTKPVLLGKPIDLIIEELFAEGQNSGEFTTERSAKECCSLLHAIVQGSTLNYILLPDELKADYTLPSVDFVVSIFTK